MAIALLDLQILSRLEYFGMDKEWEVWVTSSLSH